MSEWISVKDRLPDAGVNVLVVENLDGDLSIDITWHVPDFDENDGWMLGLYSDAKVTHWMPLPTPPKEEV